jgi:hypothetical protein
MSSTTKPTPEVNPALSQEQRDKPFQALLSKSLQSQHKARIKSIAESQQRQSQSRKISNK